MRELMMKYGFYPSSSATGLEYSYHRKFVESYEWIDVSADQKWSYTYIGKKGIHSCNGTGENELRNLFNSPDYRDLFSN